MKMNEIKGYKATMPDGRPWYAPGMQPYAIGRTYRHKGMLIPCLAGLHFCRRMDNVYGSYWETYKTRVFEVTARGRCIDLGSKQCARSLRLDRELSPQEILEKLAESASSLKPSYRYLYLERLLGSLRADEAPVAHAYQEVAFTKETSVYMAGRKREFLKAARKLAETSCVVRGYLVRAELAL
jgi:hypothetical protein